MPKKLCKHIQTCLRLFPAWRIPSRNNQTLTHHMIHQKESINFFSAIHTHTSPPCCVERLLKGLLKYFPFQQFGWMADKKTIESFSYGESCDVWEFDYFCWEFSGPGRVRGEFESAYTIFLASCGRKFTQTLFSFSDSFTGINPENCLTLIRIFYNYFLTDNPLHAVLVTKGQWCVTWARSNCNCRGTLEWSDL